MKDKSSVPSAFGPGRFALVLLVLAGCEGSHLAQQGDPLVGMRGTVPMPPAPVGNSGAATQTAGGAPPPLPGAIAVPSQAALAGGSTQPPENPRNLRIDGQPPVLPVSSPAGAARGASPGGVQVEGPIPIPDATSNRTPMPIASGGVQQTGAAAPAPPPSGGAMTYEQAQQILKQRGVVWQRLDQFTSGNQEQWKFQCSIPIPGSSNINRTYETKAPLPSDAISAIRAVIEMIEKEQH